MSAMAISWGQMSCIPPVRIDVTFRFGSRSSAAGADCGTAAAGPNNPVRFRGLYTSLLSAGETHAATTRSHHVAVADNTQTFHQR